MPPVESMSRSVSERRGRDARRRDDDDERPRRGGGHITNIYTYPHAYKRVSSGPGMTFARRSPRLGGARRAERAPRTLSVTAAAPEAPLLSPGPGGRRHSLLLDLSAPEAHTARSPAAAARKLAVPFARQLPVVPFVRQLPVPFARHLPIPFARQVPVPFARHLPVPLGHTALPRRPPSAQPPVPFALRAPQSRSFPLSLSLRQQHPPDTRDPPTWSER